ncbi:hypothetical protein IV203_032881 [Nitzschia inconspicua]|uniref:Uncharacterized protein n=1 Tax=Nitzschia inconspicua TaxID=303405 RepID=A0A9K3KKF3_9STRA|nr:hypothetical protein IV203_032881 [Nitzschia inconspicua]
MYPAGMGLLGQPKRPFITFIVLLIVVVLMKDIVYTKDVLAVQHGVNVVAIYPEYTKEVIPQNALSFTTNVSISFPSPFPSPNSYYYKTPNPAFLLFFAHSGYSNQVIAIQRAAQLAYKLNRTLVVSPVLPHKGDVPELFPSWRWAAAGSECYSSLHYDALQDRTLDQALLAEETKGPKAGFPSFHSIMDFEALRNSTGLQVLDLDEFMQHKHKRSTPKMPPSFYTSYNASIYSFCTANIDRNVSNYESVHKCQMNPPHAYPELVDHILEQMAKQHGTQELDEDDGQLYSRDCRVLNIGSGFALRSNFGNDPMAPAFNAFFNNYPLVDPWNRILKTLLKQQCFNMNFIGVHIRTIDGEIECEDSAALYDKAAEDLLQRLADRMSMATTSNHNTHNNNNSAHNNNKQNNPSKDLVIIGRANRNSKKCLKQALTKAIRAVWDKTAFANITYTNSSNRNNTLPTMPTVVTVNDLIDQHEEKDKLEKWINSIPLEVSTRYLLLDQLILAMSSVLVTQKAFGSTFQSLIANRQKYREKNIKALGLTECIEMN